MRRVGADRAPGRPNFTQHPGIRLVVRSPTPRGEDRRSCGAAGPGREGFITEHRVPRLECGETWQMVTCVWPQCGGSYRPEARTFITNISPIFTLLLTLKNTIEQVPKYPVSSSLQSTFLWLFKQRLLHTGQRDGGLSHYCFLHFFGSWLTVGGIISHFLP